MTVQCVILAGGLGTRIRHIHPDVPKALIPIADKPFIFYQLQLLHDQKINEIVIASGYKSDLIEDAVIKYKPIGVSTTCVPDGATLLGTGGAIRRLADLGLLQETFLVMYGDSYLPTDIQAVLQTFDVDKYEALLTIHPNQSRLETNNARINPDNSAYYQKGLTDPEAFGLTMLDYGLIVLARDSIENRIARNEKTDLAEYLNLISEEGRLQGYLVEDDFFEIGSPQGLQKFQEFVIEKELF